ncbi:MAG TPA: hypothetical protein VFQ51_05500 [Vicinamibacteria bacterium]|nr:hypothetical protein [Vicinamibacteria bacterium]
MTLRPGALLGLPDDADLLAHVAAFRYVVCALALGWAAVVWKARRPWWTAAGMAWVATVMGFWTLAFGRPYGLLEDREITLRSASIAVVGYAGGHEGVVSGEALPDSIWTALAARGVPPRPLQLLPTLLPFLTLPLLGGLAHLLWGRRDAAAHAALLWLAFATGAPETLRGLGLAGALWRRPEAALALPLLVAAVLLLSRTGWAARAWPVHAVALAAAAAALPLSTPRVGPPETLLLLTLDQGPWLLLGAYGLARRGDPAARTLAAAGASMLAAQALSAPVDAFTAHALYRLGLLLGAAPVVAELCERAGRWAESRLAVVVPCSAGTAALVALLVPGSFLAWWDPTRIDPVAGHSVPPLGAALYEVTDWIRNETPASAIVLASEDYAPAVAALSGRRVLRAPTLSSPPDDWRRLRAQAAVLEGRDPRKHVARYGVSLVLIAPTEFAEHGLTRPEDLGELDGFRLRYRHPEGYRVYEIVP